MSDRGLCENPLLAELLPAGRPAGACARPTLLFFFCLPARDGEIQAEFSELRHETEALLAIEMHTLPNMTGSELELPFYGVGGGVAEEQIEQDVARAQEASLAVSGRSRGAWRRPSSRVCEFLLFLACCLLLCRSFATGPRPPGTTTTRSVST